MQTLYNRLKSEFLKHRQNKWSFSLEDDEREENGVIYRNFNNPPQKEDYSKIESIGFLVYEHELEELNNIPDYVIHMHNLKVISLPIDWLDSLKMPDNIKAIVLMNTLYQKDVYKWDKKLDNLEYLKIPELIKPFEINFKNTPNLEWINLDLKAEKKDTKLTELAQINTLKHLGFSQAKSFDVFSPFANHNIEGLELFACKGKKFPIQNIVLLKDLKYIRINNISVPFDCDWLLELPNLIEIDILNIKEVINIDKILSIQKLKSLSVLNCKNPFQEIGKEIFSKKEYDVLKIQNA
ncbi:hypothetical protein [uncultured Aquimarina sp.]|uniref:hypothetical protein n=1 Tax=uncultured Aquimarina sp. TaxID=575652 RepID=UPI00260F33F1|nr:hypothetical protein [uncultured Aquimarina sp.]